MNQNGSIILQLMGEMQEPVTINDIVQQITTLSPFLPNKELKDTVRQTIEGGVRYGYVQRRNNKYFLTPDNSDHDVENGDAMRPRRRRRRSSSPRRRRGGRMSRRRRSRSSRR